jgi:colicin import membrane protein
VVQEFLLQQRLSGASNEWTFDFVDAAEAWHRKHIEEIESAFRKAVREEQEREFREKWEVVVEEALAIAFDEIFLEQFDAQLEKAALDILRERLEKWQASERAKREAAAKVKAAEEARARERDALAQKRAMEKKAKEAKEKAEAAALKKELTGR